MVRAFLLSSVAALAACNAYDPELGDRPFRCGVDEPVCPDGYECVEYSPSERVCERASGTSPDASPDGDNFACNDDSQIEPNDTTSNAWTTPIPATDDSVSYVQLAICPAGDVDLFRFGVDVNNKNMRATVTTDLSVGQLNVAVLAGDGSPVVMGTPVSGTEVVVAFNNMAIGTYFVRVSGAEGVRNNYTISIVTCDGAPCS